MHILVVEDEPWALDELMDLLQPYTAQHHISALSCAEDALAHVITHPPDLVITDIRMREIDGLELIRQLQLQYPYIAAIVLSGHGEFEYARQGLRLGLKEYLLKPVKAEQLYAAVDNALSSLDHRHARQHHLVALQLTRLLDIASGDGIDEESLLPAGWCLVVFLCENWASRTTWEKIGLDWQPIFGLLDPKATQPCHILDLDGHRRVVLFPWSSAARTTPLATIRSMHKMIMQAGVIVHTTYGIKYDTDAINVIFRAALDRLANHIQLEQATFVAPDAPGLAPDPALRDTVRLIEWHVAQGNWSSVVDEIRQILNHLQRTQATVKQITTTLHEIWAILRRSRDSRVTSVSLPEVERVTAFMHTASTYQQVIEWIETQLQPLILNHPTVTTPRRLVSELVALVHTSYADDLSLQDFAAAHHVSLAYFSRLFKSEIGMTFSDYLIRTRIEKAKALLIRSPMRPSEISSLVGYEDPKYFSQLFKKITGMSPLDYQQRSQTNQPE